MATSGSFDYTIDRDDVITEALQLVGRLADGESPTADQLTSCGRTLNMLVKAWQSDGLQLFRRKTYSFSVVSGTTSYVFGTGGTVTETPTRMLYVYRQISGEDVPLTALSDTEYQNLSDKDSTSTPTSYYYEYLGKTANLYLWPTGGASETITIYCRGERPIYDFDAATDDADVPDYYYLALSYGLALAIAPKYGCEETQAARIEKLATYYKAEALAYDVENNTSVMLEPRFRGRYG